MNRFVLPVIWFIVISCNNSTPTTPLNPENKAIGSLELGKQIFEGKGQCLSCHKPNQKGIGPSIIEIATIYKDQGADMVDFLKGTSKPIVDPSQFALMRANLEITKKMSDQELEALTDYMYSFLK